MDDGLTNVGLVNVEPDWIERNGVWQMGEGQFVTLRAWSVNRFPFFVFAVRVAGRSALRCLWVQFVGLRSWCAGGLASPGSSGTRSMHRNMKHA